ncbi:cystinosin homolog [Ctenocephalides felis]|uniref:cystinosin homolog n=1 Tax=Ctenocephalides felis TaxID=7515 RepID=UPI000E6E110C|nr:cystinosin homolog [Ctenocephalides felis]
MRDHVNDTLYVILEADHKNVLHIYPKAVAPENSEKFKIEAMGLSPGLTFVTYNVSDFNNENSSTRGRSFLRAVVQRAYWVDTLSTAVGWLYFLAWSISFYPQIVTNWRRKSVVGLNFDFVTLSVVGFAMYALFNVGLYAFPTVQKQYIARYPRSLNPVQINDVVFSVHAFIATVITAVQCFIYERGDQRVSSVGRLILAACFFEFSASWCLMTVDLILPLDFLYHCSYIKLGTTIIKYIPQAYMNYERKSTIGWSIGNIFLDIAGGVLSMLQMILNAYNFDDWISIFGDPTKFGLGLFSVIFDIFFIIQHYVFYKQK